MRKLVLSIMCFIMVSTYVFAEGLIDFSVSIIDRKPLSNGRPKAPMRPPVVYLDDCTLTFAVGHPDYELTIKDEDGETVYTTVVTSAETLITLPSSLTGSYVIELTMGYWKFTGWITLY